jgi:hypothetical protein
VNLLHCAWCHDVADSDDYPEGFLIWNGADVFICERRMLNKEQEDGEPAPEERDAD